MNLTSPYGPLGSPLELERFAELKHLLPAMSRAYQAQEAVHTSVVVPSISVNQEELAKVDGSASRCHLPIIAVW